MSEEIQEVINSNPEWYRNLQYDDAKGFIKDNINGATRSFIAIGYYLKYIKDNQMYSQDGYESIWELAQTEFGISKPQASKFMSINDRFSKDGNSPILLDQYKDFSSSKLSEMLYLTDEQLEQVTPVTTVAEIREIRKPEEVVSTSKQETEPEKTSRWPKVCKWDGKSNCVAICGASANCCAECVEHGYCNVECGWQDERISKQSGKCIHRPEYPCTLPEASKLAQGDGANCNVKCCWSCLKREGCGYQCNSSAHRPAEVKQELQCFDNLTAYWCRREMTVELYELAKSDKDEDIDVFNQYFKEKYIHDGYAPAHNTPGYEISFRTDVEYGVRFDDAEKTGYSWQLLIELVCQEAENETPASKPCNFHENENGLKRLKEIRKEIRVRNNSQKQPENVDNESEIVNDVDETVIETSESVTDESDGDLDPVETVEADIIQTVPEETASDSRLTPTKMKHSGDYYTCPSCGAVLVAEYYTKQIFWNFCPYCGQAIVRTDAKTSNPDRPEWYRRFFFGAYSKNNRPIREGDIIEVNGRQFRIDWDQKEFRFIAEAVVKKYRYADHEMCPIYEITKSEIVGSIYEEETDGIH